MEICRITGIAIFSRIIYKRVQKALSSGTKKESFTKDEVENTVKSLQDALDEETKEIDWESIRGLIKKVAHLSHKNWEFTEKSARQLGGIIGTPSDSIFQKMFSRVLEDGNWKNAEAYSQGTAKGKKPWVVLVSGLNGIRKTTSVYQKWFRDVLFEALGSTYDGKREDLPDGSSSFFRQLDFMIATIANKDFRKLYEIEEVAAYSTAKAKIFGKYRMLAEMLGIVLLKAAKEKKMNVMVETSGKDITSFHYIDHFFPEKIYNKLVLHFSINDIKFAEKSVDTRMQREMKNGAAVLKKKDAKAIDVIKVNAGGPYGSAVLKGVQEASNAVWERVLKGEAGTQWYKASISIHAHEDKPWTAAAEQSNASKEVKIYNFAPLNA